MKSDRDIEQSYSDKEFIEKLRRLADAIESGEKFEIQIGGERIYVPVRATYSIEHGVGAVARRSSFRLNGLTRAGG